MRVPFCKVITQHRVLSSLFLSAIISYCVSSFFADLYMLGAPAQSASSALKRMTKYPCQMLLESWTYQFCSWFPSMTVCLTFAHSCSAKHPKPKNLKFVTVSGKQERRCFLHACFESDQLILKNFLSHVLKPFSFFKTFLSYSVVWKLCAFISLIISYLSSFCCFLFVGHVVVELEGEKLQKLETRL